jgi:hypothetical protein
MRTSFLRDETCSISSGASFNRRRLSTVGRASGFALSFYFIAHHVSQLLRAVLDAQQVLDVVTPGMSSTVSGPMNWTSFHPRRTPMVSAPCAYNRGALGGQHTSRLTPRYPALRTFPIPRLLMIASTFSPELNARVDMTILKGIAADKRSIGTDLSTENLP